MSLDLGGSSQLTGAVPLFALTRGPQLELVVHGAYSWISASSSMSEQPTAHIRVPCRSLLKPWQLLATGVAIEGSDGVMPLASHAGTKLHVEALSRLSRALGVLEEELLCPSCLPMDADAQCDAKAAGAMARRFFHPCAGKHLAIMAACRRNGWPTQSYRNIDHPYSQRLSALLEKSIGSRLTWVADSCGLPTPLLTLSEQGALWRRLALDRDESVHAVRQCFASSPDLVGGPGRLDSALIQDGAGNVLAKEGADGLLAIQAIEDGHAQTIVVKLASGYRLDFLAYAALALLMERQSEVRGAMQKVLTTLEHRVRSVLPADQQLFFYSQEGGLWSAFA